MDIGGVIGTLHISEIAGRLVHHPREVLAVGQHVTVRILKLDQQKSSAMFRVAQLDKFSKKGSFNSAIQPSFLAVEQREADPFHAMDHTIDRT